LCGVVTGIIAGSMPKPVRRARGRRANTLAAPDARPLLERILDDPNLALVVPQLQPEQLHQIIKHHGLEDCADLVALATPEQLARVFDLDLWRGQPGNDEQFDADRFGVWLEVLLESGATVAAGTLAQMDADLVVTALAQHLRVFDRATLSPAAATDDGLYSDIGGYFVMARRTGSWDAIVTVLRTLNEKHRDCFHRVMRACRTLSNTGFELDGLDDLLSSADQALFELAVDREQRREKQGYVAPAQARAFLQMSRHLRLEHRTPPAANPIATAYFQAVEPTDTNSGQRRLPGTSDAAPAWRDPSEELAYLANTLVAGCSIQARPFTAQETSDAVEATCALGRENWPRHWPQGPQGPEARGLISLFQVGWTVLHDDVAMYAAGELIRILKTFRSEDPEVQAGLRGLRIAMTKHWRAGAPWRARDALDVIATLDMPAWAALLGLIDECPVIHAGMAASRDSRTRAVSPSDFEFISENSQIASVREFMQSLPETLR
jgi:hypothetical protein